MTSARAVRDRVRLHSTGHGAMMCEFGSEAIGESLEVIHDTGRQTGR